MSKNTIKEESFLILLGYEFWKDFVKVLCRKNHHEVLSNRVLFCTVNQRPNTSSVTEREEVPESLGFLLFTHTLARVPGPTKYDKNEKSYHRSITGRGPRHRRRFPFGTTTIGINCKGVPFTASDLSPWRKYNRQSLLPRSSSLRGPSEGQRCNPPCHVEGRSGSNGDSTPRKKRYPNKKNHPKRHLVLGMQPKVFDHPNKDLGTWNTLRLPPNLTLLRYKCTGGRCRPGDP